MNATVGGGGTLMIATVTWGSTLVTNERYCGGWGGTLMIATVTWGSTLVTNERYCGGWGDIDDCYCDMGELYSSLMNATVGGGGTLMLATVTWGNYTCH